MEEERRFTAKNGQEITLRPAEPEDSSGIIDTIRANAQERSFVLMEQYGKSVAGERTYIAGLDRSRDLLLVAKSGPEVVGCLAALQAHEGRRDETAHILNVGLHLKEAYRGLGIGSQMLGYATDWARQREFQKLEASIFTTNKHSLRLFSNAGFAEEGIRHKRIRVGREYIDEVLMGKVIE